MQVIKFNDITLRELSRRIKDKLSLKEIIEMTKNLDRLNLDVISLPQLYNAKVGSLLVRTIAAAVKKSTLSLPVGYTVEDAEIAISALSDAAHPRLCVEAPLSAVQMEFVCGKKPESVIEMIETLVRKCREHCADVEFAAIDATRSDPEFMYRAIRTAIAAGATTVTVCDSAGTMLAHEFSAFIKNIYENVPELAEIALAVRCSDELSMAAACAVSAINAGAVEVDVEVSGSTAPSLETMSQIIRLRGDNDYSSNIKYTELHRSIEQMKWISRSDRSKTSAFDTGFASSDSEEITLDANDDISAIGKAAERLGYDLSSEDLVKVYENFTNIVKKKTTVGTKELEAIIATCALQVPPAYELVSFVINSGNIINATANIHVRHNDEDLHGLAVGDGPIDAAFLAIEQITGHHYELDDFQIQSVTEGREAMGSTIVKLRSNGKLYSGSGISTDIIGSGIRAYLNALNKIRYEENR
ncbi:MAG: hypothetical protein HUJ86_07070 [Synergistes sp.]|nr:hypothetical protein [Synergistes sp.]